MDRQLKKSPPKMRIQQIDISAKTSKKTSRMNSHDSKPYSRVDSNLSFSSRNSQRVNDDLLDVDRKKTTSFKIKRSNFKKAKTTNITERPKGSSRDGASQASPRIKLMSKMDGKQFKKVNSDESDTKSVVSASGRRKKGNAAIQ